MNKWLLLGSIVVAAIFAPSDGCKCGVERVEKQIFGGHEAQKGRYPWMVALSTKISGDEYALCGGSLINNRYIMTAAHCIPKNSKPSDIIAMLGVHKAGDKWKEGNGRKKLQIQSYIIHKQYARYPGSPYDIALLKLKNPVDIAKWSPICLPNFSQHSNLFLIGWGNQNSGGEMVPAYVLYEVDLDEVNNSTCKKKYWRNYYIPELRLCAGTIGGACGGDSGGPLSTRKNGRIYQVGITSSGAKCEVEGYRFPDIYERVTAHLDWIKSNTKGAIWCTAPHSPKFTKN